LAGSRDANFVWPTGDSLEPWERYLYAFTYLVFALEAGHPIGPNMISSFKFPQVHGARDCSILVPVIQLLRRPQILCPEGTEVMEAYKLSRNLQMTMTARAAADHIHDIGRGQRQQKKYGVRGNPRVAATMHGSEGWLWLIQDSSTSAPLVALLESFKGIQPSDSRCACSIILFRLSRIQIQDQVASADAATERCTQKSSES
jgi:hypothetical protein